MITAWNANMDIQLALDPYAIITYIVNYVNKDETGLTKFMQEAVSKVPADETVKEKLRALKITYLTHQQIGASEAVYRVIHSMKLKDSNITCIFVSSGFPENRSCFYRKVSDSTDEKFHYEEEKQEEDDDDHDEDENEGEDPYSTNVLSEQIEGRAGNYQKSISIIDRYAARPKYLKNMCLAQFATSYTYQKKRPKTAVFDDDGKSEKKSTQKVFNEDTFLPRYIVLKDGLGVMRLRLEPAVLRIHTSKKKEWHEQHYSEMLLFSPWMDEEKELPLAEDDCLDEYIKRKHTIEVNRETIYPGEGTIDLMEGEDLELRRPAHLIEMLDNQGDQENTEDQEEGIADDPDFETFGYTENLSLPQQEQFEDFKFKQICLPNDFELQEMTRQLVPEQMNPMRKVLSSCKDIVKAEKYPKIKKEPVRMIIHGGAGVGKSQTIRVMANQAEKILRKAGHHPNRPRVLLTAFTGKAASLIDGTTLHSAFKLGKFGKIYEYKPLSDKPLAELRENLADLKLIIIDEVSLVSADMLYTIHMRLKEIFKTSLAELFANIHIVLVGDLLQLSPVQGKYVFKTPKSPKFAVNKDTLELWKSFEPMILTHNHRQGEEKEWAEALNEFRVGLVTEKGEALLKERQTTAEHLDEDAMHIFYEIKHATKHNATILNGIKSPLVSIKASIAHPKGSYIKIDEKKGTIGSTQFQETLDIKIGSRVTLIFNVNVIDDLVNGSNGTVVGIEKKGDKVHCIIVNFDNEKTGYIQRQRHPIYSNRYKEQNGTPIFREHLEFQVKSKRGFSSTATARLFQFPLSLNYAQTSHKMQGQTVKPKSKVIIHWAKNLQQGMAYVMLGRSSRRQDIFISGKLDTSQIRCNPDALEESNRLQEVFDENVAKMNEKRSNNWKISYLNVRSLKAHVEDMKKDNFLIDSDILGLGETHLNPNDTIHLDGFEGSFANYGRGKGVAGFTKLDLISEPKILSSNSASAILMKTHHFHLYLSDDYDKPTVFKLLESWINPKIPTAVMGDINEDALYNSIFEGFMRSNGLNQIVDKPTRESGRLIDHIYVNNAMNEIGFSTQVDANYYSDHDIISLYISRINDVSC